MNSRLTFDHAFRAVPDLDTAAKRFLDEYGFGSVAGGRHQGQGTANRIIPLGASYIELIAVVDRAEASESPLGRWVASRTEMGHPWDGLVLHTEDVGGEGERLDVEVSEFSRLAPDGRLLTWRMAGLDHLLEDDLPFFITFEGPADAHPGRDRAQHRVEPSQISAVTWSGDADRLASWIADPGLSLTIADDPSQRSITVATTQGDMTI